jgi:CDP-diacylglycerol pyrophosphatase
MENRNIIIILIVIICILVAALGIMFSMQKTDDDSDLTVEDAVTDIVNDTASVDTTQYPKYSPHFGSYRTVESQQELAVIETSNGEYYVFGGDGAYNYAGHDSNGNIKLGSYVGKY